MVHTPEHDAALFLVGAMRPRVRATFERHLLECEECWSEVTLAQRGRIIAESGRETAPPALRDRIRATIAAADQEKAPAARPRRGLQHIVAKGWMPIGAAALVLATVAIVGVVTTQPSGSQPAIIRAALAYFGSRKRGLTA